MEYKKRVSHPWSPSISELELLNDVTNKWKVAQERRDTSYLEFSDMTLTEYINRSDVIYNALQRKISFQGKELSDLQSNIPRNKVSAINAKVSVNMPTPIITAWGKDGMISRGGTMTLQGLNDWTEDRKKARILHIKKGNELFVHGTVITYNDFDKRTREVQDIIEMGLEPKTKKKTILEKFGCYTKIVPLLEIYFASYYIPDVQDQPYIFWKRTFLEENFKAEFNSKTFYKNTDKVLPGMMFAQDDNGSYSIESQEVSPGKIVVLKMFDKLNDKLVTIANGVIIQNIPFPWYHKNYPFALTQNDFFSNTDFVYGMSIPHKLSWDVEAIEFLVNSMFEQAKIAINPPIINYGLTDFEDDVLYAGRVIKSEGQQGDLQTLQINGIDPSVQQLLSYFNNDSDINSVDNLTAGMSSGGKGVTARRDVMAQNNAREMLGISRIMLLDLQKQETELQVANIIQFYPQKVSMTVLGKEGKEKMEEVYQTFRVFSERIPKFDSMGKNIGTGSGLVEINIDEQTIDKKELDLAEDKAKIAGVNLEKFSPSPEFIRNLKYLVKIPYSDDYLSNNDTKFNKLVTLGGLLAQFAPEILNKQGFGKRLTVLSGEDESDIILEERDMQQMPTERDTQGSLRPTGVERQMRQPEQVGLNKFGG